MNTSAVTTSQVYDSTAAQDHPGDWALMSASDPGYMTCSWNEAGTPAGDSSVALAGSNHGGTDDPQWWQVDLGANYRITAVDILGMNLVADYNSGVTPKVCTSYDGSGCSDCGSSTISTGDVLWAGNVCDLTGRYVRLEKPLISFNWHFCRVRVTGARAGGI